jgi:hypothetical protein
MNSIANSAHRLKKIRKKSLQSPPGHPVGGGMGRMDIRLDPEATFYEIGTTVLYKASNMPRTSKT